MNFLEWLSTQEGKDTPVSDLARDACIDPNFPLTNDLDDLLHYMETVGAPAEVQRVVRVAHGAWLSERAAS